MENKKLEIIICKKGGFISLTDCRERCLNDYKDCNEYKIQTHVFGSMLLRIQEDSDDRMKIIYGDSQK